MHPSKLSSAERQPGTLYIISAASGTGKTSLVQALLEKNSNLKVSISHTTREKRAGEQNGVNYHFVSINEFQDMIAAAKFLEFAQVFTNYYGTSQQWVEDTLVAGYDVILEIDWQGAQQIRRLMPAAISIFILPPNKQALYDRLKKRNQDKPDIIAKRLQGAQNEISHCPEYDYVVINDNFDTALADLLAIIRSQRLRFTVQQQPLSKLLNEFGV